MNRAGMSVNIIRYQKSDGDCVTAFISTSDHFTKVWVGAYERLGLTAIPLLDNPYPVTEELRLRLIDELLVLRQQAMKWSAAGDYTYDDTILERIDDALACLTDHSVEYYDFVFC